MNRLKKILLSFALPFFFLLISVSNAIPSGVSFSLSNQAGGSYRTSEVIPGYTYSNVASIVNNYYSYPDTESYKVVLEEMLSAFDNNGIQYVLFSKGTGFNDKYLLFSDKNIGIDFFTLKRGSNDIRMGVYFNNNTGDAYVAGVYDYCQSVPYVSGKAGTFYTTVLLKDTGSVEYANVDIYCLKYVNSDNCSWDGESYYYKVPVTEDPDTPSLPSNSEIAQAVQAFYNSDYYKNNTEFDDFMVMYNYKTQYFSFVGHNFGTNLGQVIVPPDYEYEGYSYDQDWWKFFLRNISSEIASNLWNRYYWLYSSNDFGESITYDGKGYINNLIDIHFATSSIIVYSTTDYPVVKIETDENGVLTPVEGTIPGNQYTYDENLDPTTNEYNPLENFVPTNPIQDILGDVDFEEINKTFEENKDILNIEGASWLFTANNNFISYFIGFLSLLIVFLLISRILGG